MSQVVFTFTQINILDQQFEYWAEQLKFKFSIKYMSVILPKYNCVSVIAQI